MTYGPNILHTAEGKRLEEDTQNIKKWKRWGPYLGERQWATVREDYSHDGDAWNDFPFDHSKSRAYRWGEDGLAGVSDNHQLLNFSIALWNENDDFLKEKLFGVTGPQGNHGEDVKEIYHYLDNTPTHSYMKYLYKYPQSKFPYEKLVEENQKRSRLEKEYELPDTKIFDESNFFDVIFEVAKDENDPDEVYFRITAYNRSAAPAPLHILPHAVFRNTWSWGIPEEKNHPKPSFSREFDNSDSSIKIDHWKFGKKRLVFSPSPGCNDHSDDVEPKLLFTENETNTKKLYNQPNKSKYVKDAFHEYVVDEISEAINPQNVGTKACAWFSFDADGGVPPGDYVTIRYKLSTINDGDTEKSCIIDEEAFDQVFVERQDEADNYYWSITPLPITEELRTIQRQAFAGLLWTKQYYGFVHQYWAHGDPATPKPPPNRANGRNKHWNHLYIDQVLSLPDKWEYPFFAAWDTAFHCIPLAMIDPAFAKNQLDLLTREWYMHPNGQIPAYEWNFSDVNPPVHAWSAFRIYKIERKMYGREDRDFLERVFQKLLLNFTWWVNRKDSDGNNVFEGGFLGLDNIGIFNRSEPLPTGGVLEQADSTGWMAFFCLQMLNIALELSKERSVYEDIASKFFEHFLLIADAMTFRDASPDETEATKKSLWNEEDQFFYDSISYDHVYKQQLPVRSLVGLIPLYACLTLEPELLEKFPSFKKRLDWSIENKSWIFERNIACTKAKGVGERLLLSLVNKERLVAILEKMLDEDEFLSDYGIRSLSKYHEKHPFEMNVHGQHYNVSYLPGESDSGLFGGNSNWRGPIWFPTNFLLVESLQRFYLYYGQSLKVECPKRSGIMLNLAQVAEEIQHRLIKLFTQNEGGYRACNGDSKILNCNEFFSDNVPFYEYFDGDTGRGLGASHQCGWTALVAKWIQDVGVSLKLPSTPYTPKTSATSDYFNIDDNEIIKYYPSGGKFSAKLARRRSGKSLVNLTSQVLELTEEECKIYQREIPMTPGAKSIVSEDDNYSELGLSRQSTRVSSAMTEEHEKAIIEQIRTAIQNYKFKKNEKEDDVSSDELEAHS
ncbi:uncharacterized protein ASCRUDRAFT_9986 [Ascoidea rubescens DSM 1968]|uniref:Mannosyl-oligosaccharide glucosidase n=1 Tax=Ascoidea rubescens DSM 1968 TaxID=1344418 RepID=A0A1D2VAD7_9ASCO|nr:Six-hairpin glycosidase [Ascoidea rubescens DSM 1968]ODV58632.1 Six-hairpin glycosidase [Ascoidea rubescens DSM 1968]